MAVFSILGGGGGGGGGTGLVSGSAPTLYVSTTWGNDSNDGSFQAPFKTFNGLNTHLIGLAGGSQPTATNPFQIMIDAGTYAETTHNGVFYPSCIYIGQSNASVVISVTGNIVFYAAATQISSVNSILSLSNITFNSPVSLDLVVLNSHSNLFYCSNCIFAHDFYISNNGSDIVRLFARNTFNSSTSATFDNITAITPGLQNNLFYDLTFNQVASLIINMRLYQNIVLNDFDVITDIGGGEITFVGNSTLNLTISGGGTNLLTLNSDGVSLPTSWDDVVLASTIFNTTETSFINTNWIEHFNAFPSPIMMPSFGYINNTGDPATVLILPTKYPEGSTFSIINTNNSNSTNFRINQNTGQQIRGAGGHTSLGASGYVEGIGEGAFISFVAANSGTFFVIGSLGTINYH